MNLPIEAKLLGKQVSYPNKYAPEILVAVPRSLNREIYGLEASSLPFCGVDVWHAYELGFLTKKGLPVTGVLKLVYPCNSEFIVESKSLKLYLNSFNMGKYGDSAVHGIEIILKTIGNDLSQLLKTSVTPKFFSDIAIEMPFDFSGFEILEKHSEMESLCFEVFTETPSLLVGKDSPTNELRVATHLLRSNCKITHQPDWGSAFIYMKGNKQPSLPPLLQYIVSIRNENHFHEEICEMIYKRLLDVFIPEELMVTTIYTRRGGIDICPVRASHPRLLPKHLINPDTLSAKLLRQ